LQLVFGTRAYGYETPASDCLPGQRTGDRKFGVAWLTKPVSMAFTNLIASCCSAESGRKGLHELNRS
jgi:hypothetical protein